MAFTLIRRALIAILFIASTIAYGGAQTPQAIPALTSRVVDHSGTLSSGEIASLEARLAGFEKDAGTQIVVLLVPTTAPEDIASYANRVANAWKVGRKDVGDGLLLVVAVQDRKLRIEVAKTLEGAIPDLAARRIIDDAIAPQFKDGRFAQGIDAGISQLIARVRGEALPAPTADARPGRGFDWVDLGIFLFFGVPIAASIARTAMGPIRGTVVIGVATGVLAYIFSSSVALAVFAAFVSIAWGMVTANSGGIGGSRLGWGIGDPSGASGGSGDSGGFSSGGGGDFGGGGASGDW